VALSLTDRGLVDLDLLWITTAALSLTLGFAIARWWALAVPPALVAFVVLGVDRDWWGGGRVEGWQAEVAWVACICLVLGLLGVLAGPAVRRWRYPNPLLRIGLVGACLAGLAGYWYFDTRPPDLEALREAPETIYYLGTSFEGLRLTHADRTRGTALVVYGDCDLALGQNEGGCGPPLQLQNVLCPGERPAVVIFASAGGGQAYRAIRALRPVDDDAPMRRPRVSVGSNAFGPCLPG
jgi:hypothetical protein